MDRPQAIYAISTAETECFLVQGEIISGLIHVHIDLSSLETPPLRVERKIHPFAVILTQGCDLEQDFRARRREANEDKEIPAVLFCEAMLASDLRSRVKKSDHWNRLSNNKDERYHFFQAVEREFDLGDEGLPELGVDFKRIFTIPTDEVYHRIRAGEAKRRCSLRSPYLEHFCQRFANFLSRVALPEPHSST